MVFSQICSVTPPSGDRASRMVATDRPRPGTEHFGDSTHGVCRGKLLIIRRPIVTNDLPILDSNFIMYTILWIEVFPGLCGHHDCSALTDCFSQRLDDGLRPATHISNFTQRSMNHECLTRMNAHIFQRGGNIVFCYRFHVFSPIFLIVIRNYLSHKYTGIMISAPKHRTVSSFFPVGFNAENSQLIPSELTESAALSLVP